MARSSILSETLGCLVTSEALLIYMLTGHRPALSLTGFAVGSIEYCLCTFRQLTFFRLTIHKYTHLPSSDTVSDRVCVGLIEYYICNFNQLAYVRLTIHKYTHLISPDTVFEGVCRWPDRVFSLQLYEVSVLPINNPQMYSLDIGRH